MKMKKVLMIAYYFPPVGGGGVQRPLKFVKYLPHYGWQPVVLTVKNPDYDYFDKSLLSDIPSGTIVAKAFSINIWRLWRSMKYGNRSLYDKKNDRKRNVGVLSRLFWAIMRPVEIFVNNFIFIPDDYSMWFPFAFWEGLKIIKKEGIDLIYATGNPWTSFIVAKCLAIFSGIPFVLDFRDPWVLCPYVTRKERNTFKYKISQRLEYSCIKKASRVININENITQIFKRYYKSVSKHKFITISHGFDSEDFDNVIHKKNNKFVISHVGTFYHNRRPDKLLEALNLLFKMHPHMRQSVEVRFIGITGSFAEKSVKSYDLKDVVKILPYCNHKESIFEMCSADLLILIQANIRGKKAETTTGKVYEYLASGSPILALVSKGNEVGQIIRSANAGVVLDPDESLEIANFILNNYKEWKSGKPKERTRRILNEYDRKNLTGMLAKNFNAVVNNTETAGFCEPSLNVIQFLDNEWNVDHRRAYAQKMSEIVPVLAVNPPLTIDKLFRLKTIFTGKWRRTKRLQKMAHSFWIYTPFSFVPYSVALYFPFFNTINRLMLKISLRNALHSLGMNKNLAVVISHPCHSVVMGLLNESVLCYEVYDSYADRPHLRDITKKLFRRSEDHILNTADIVFCSARNLAESKKKMHSNAHFIPNAADVSFFRRSVNTSTAIPNDLLCIPSPRLGLIGNVNDIADIKLLNFLAEHRKNWSIVCVGKINGSRTFMKSEEYQCSTQLPNMYYLGFQPYELLPNYLKGLDVCLLPYLINDYTMNVYPSKIHQYLAAGKPVVSTALPEMLCFADIIDIAYSHEDFLLYCERALSSGTLSDIDRRVSFSRANTIEIRNKEKIDLLQDVLNAKRR